MLPKENRVDKRDIDFLSKKGNSINSSDLSFKFILTTDATLPRISFIAPKNIAKLAVLRNSLRRRGYDALRKHIRSFPRGLIGVFLFKKNQQDVPTIENEIKNILNKIN